MPTGEMRSRLRLVSALVLLSFVLCHLAAHSTLLVSEAFASGVLVALMRPWRSGAGTVLLLGAFLVHYANALWSIYVRRSLRLKRWEWAQLVLGLFIPLLLALHIAATRISESALGTDSSYAYLLTLYWVVAPYLGIVQVAALATVWMHAMIGLHFWLRTRRGYPQWRSALGALALLIPTLALSGFVSAGNQVAREAQKDPKFAERTLEDASAGPEIRARADRIAVAIIATHLALLLLVLAARVARRKAYERRMPPVLTHPAGRLP